MIFKVCIPGLHLSLGIFNRIWKLLENSCQELDFKRSSEVCGASHSDSNIQKLSSVKIEVQKKYGSVLSEMLTYCVLTSNSGGTNELEDSLKAELVDIEKNIQIKVNISLFVTHSIDSLCPNSAHPSSHCFSHHYKYTSRCFTDQIHEHFYLKSHQPRVNYYPLKLCWL